MAAVALARLLDDRATQPQHVQAAKSLSETAFRLEHQSAAKVVWR
jgi:hypothetical protein